VVYNDILHAKKICSCVLLTPKGIWRQTESSLLPQGSSTIIIITITSHIISHSL